MFSMLDSHDKTEIAIASYIAISAVFVIIGLRRDRTEASPWAGRFFSFVFLVLSLAVLLYGRRQILSYDLILNPDEAQMAANAMLAQHGWLNWNIVDTTTSGPLNSMILGWPYLFGGDITLFSTRLTGVACVYGLALFLFLALRRLSDDGTAIVTIAPAIFFFAGVSFYDVVHYSSEHFSILLLSIAICFFVYSFRANQLGYLIGAALVLGMVPFAKLQAGPMAAAAGSFVLARSAYTGMTSSPKSVVRNVAAVVGAAVLPAVIFLVPLSFSGGFDDFLKSYFIEQRLRVTGWSNPLPSLIGIVPVFRAMPESLVMPFVIAVVLVGFAACIGLRRIVAPTIAWTLVLGAMLVPVAFASISVTGRVYFHYLLLAVPALMILGGATLAAMAQYFGPENRRSMLLRWLSLGIVLLILLPGVRGDPFARAGGAFLQGQPFTATHTLAWLHPTETDRIVCWGWQAECYVNAAIPPSTRDATNENQIYGTILRPYFRSRFLADFARGRPDFVIDAVAPGSFRFDDPDRQGIASFPEFSKIIDRDFVLLSQVNPPGRCQRLYVRRARLAAFEKSLIKFASVIATDSVAGHPAQALDDRSIFETCDDNWLLPKGMLGTATIDFAEAGPLASVAILNTRNGSRGDQASDRIRLSARLGGKAIAVKELTLEPFPRWTYYRFDKPLTADGLTIEILSYRGIGAGLNEVKAYRD